MTMTQTTARSRSRRRSTRCSRSRCRCASRRTTAAPTGPEDSPYHLHLATERGPDLPAHRARRPRLQPGLRRRRPRAARARIPATPTSCSSWSRATCPSAVPSPAEAVTLLRSLGLSHLKPIAPPPEESPSRLRRTLEGVRHSLGRDADAIHHHYDVSNVFYEHVLGPSMTYTCALFPTEDRHPRGGPAREVRPRRPQARPPAGPAAARPRLRLGRDGPARGARVRRARPRRDPLARAGLLGPGRIKEEGLDHLAEVRFMDYRHVEETGFDAISSIGLTEHIGVKQYPSYFGFIRDRLPPAGSAAQPLHHPARQPVHRDRRVPRPLRLPGRRADRLRPDHHRGPGRWARGAARGEHPGPLRQDPGRPGAATSRTNWDACVAEVGEGTARVWGLYMAGLPAGLRAQRDPAAPRAGHQDRRERGERVPLASHLLTTVGR